MVIIKNKDSVWQALRLNIMLIGFDGQHLTGQLSTDVLKLSNTNQEKKAF